MICPKCKDRIHGANKKKVGRIYSHKKCPQDFEPGSMRKVRLYKQRNK